MAEFSDAACEGFIWEYLTSNVFEQTHNQAVSKQVHKEAHFHLCDENKKIL